MCLLIRFVQTISQYSGAHDWTNLSDAQPAVGDFIDERGEKNVSIYRVEKLQDINRVVAAYALSHEERIQPRRCLIVPERDFFTVTQLNLDDKELGRTPDAFVNALHRNLIGPTLDESLHATFAFGKFGSTANYKLPVMKMICAQSVKNECCRLESLSGKLRASLDK